MIVTISGLPGSGTSTVGKSIATRFSVKYICTGELFRNMAKEKGMTLEEFGKFAEKDPKFDKETDDRQVELSKEGNILLDGRLSGWLIKDADLKIWLTGNLQERAERVGQRDGLGKEEAVKNVKEREATDAKRYKEFYNIDIKDLSIYDLVINSSKGSAKGIENIIEGAIKEWKLAQSA